MSDVRSACIKVFSNVLNVDAGLINDDASPETLFEWDSLAHVQLMLELEKEFSIEISPDQALEFESFKMIVDWLEVQQNKN